VWPDLQSYCRHCAVSYIFGAASCTTCFVFALKFHFAVVSWCGCVVVRLCRCAVVSWCVCVAVPFSKVLKMDKWLKTGSFVKRSISQVTIEEGVPGPSNTKLVKSEKDEVQVNTKKPKTFFRKYSTDYIKYGFTFVGTEEEPLPQCVICFETLANQSMKPSKLERHISTKHPECVNKPLTL